MRIVCNDAIDVRLLEYDVMIATREEMEAASIPLEKRDYCAHLMLDFLKCKNEKFPWVASCKHELHDYDYCQYQDYLLRMKEYEREKRLLERSKRIHARQSTELLED